MHHFHQNYKFVFVYVYEGVSKELEMIYEARCVKKTKKVNITPFYFTILSMCNNFQSGCQNVIELCVFIHFS